MQHQWYWMTTRDQYYNNWIFHKEDKERLVLRDTYKPLQCPVCGKIDEDKALELPIESDVRIRGLDDPPIYKGGKPHTRPDILTTGDDVICVTDHAQRIMQENEIQGFRFVYLPGEQKFSIAIPTVRVPVDLSKAGFQYEGKPCPCCGRYAVAVAGPLTGSYPVPDNVLTAFSPSATCENIRGRMQQVMISIAVKRILKQNRVLGIEYMRPF